MNFGLFALPAGFLGSAFVENLQQRKASLLVLSALGKELGATPAA